MAWLHNVQYWFYDTASVHTSSCLLPCSPALASSCLFWRLRFRTVSDPSPIWTRIPSRSVRSSASLQLCIFEYFLICSCIFFLVFSFLRARFMCLAFLHDVHICPLPKLPRSSQRHLLTRASTSVSASRQTPSCQSSGPGCQRCRGTPAARTRHPPAGASPGSC